MSRKSRLRLETAFLLRGARSLCWGSLRVGYRKLVDYPRRWLIGATSRKELGANQILSPTSRASLSARRAIRRLERAGGAGESGRVDSLEAVGPSG